MKRFAQLSRDEPDRFWGILGRTRPDLPRHADEEAAAAFAECVRRVLGELKPVHERRFWTPWARRNG